MAKDKTKKTVYYDDLENDDFAGNSIVRETVDESFKYIRTGVFWRALEAIAYYGIALPLVYIFCKAAFGLRIKNRRSLKVLRKTGYFVYCNHTCFSDAFLGPIVAAPKKAFVIASPDAVSIKGLRSVVMMLGCIPIPTSRKAMRNFTDAVERRIEQGKCVVVFPEAHIWPFYTGIRPFSVNAFHYPAKLCAPVVPMVITYRNRRLFGFINCPGMTLNIGEAIYPDAALSDRERRESLRDKTYAFMCEKAAEHEQYEHILYVKRGKDE